MEFFFFRFFEIAFNNSPLIYWTTVLNFGYVVSLKKFVVTFPKCGLRVMKTSCEMNLILFYTIFYSRNIFTRINYYIIWKQKGSCRSLVFPCKIVSFVKKFFWAAIFTRILLWPRNRSRDVGGWPRVTSHTNSSLLSFKIYK